MPVVTRSQARWKSPLSTLPIELFDQIWELAEPESQIHRIDELFDQTWELAESQIHPLDDDVKGGGRILTIRSPPPPVSLAVCRASRNSALRRRYQHLPRYLILPDTSRYRMTAEGPTTAICDLKSDKLFIGEMDDLPCHPWAAFRNIIIQHPRMTGYGIPSHMARFPSLEAVFLGMPLQPDSQICGTLKELRRVRCRSRVDFFGDAGDLLWLESVLQAHGYDSLVSGHKGFPGLKLCYWLIRSICICKDHSHHYRRIPNSRRRGETLHSCCDRYWESTTPKIEKGFRYAGRELVCHASI
ncbi:hypothetical protein CPLU01_15701 [Colletotrichum plurivorum]|uniref:2EXR domain-containing protein n=1 Tax=Colletotrichum plurivorum TaxID=2175906 RepID=A0A8H6J8T0_9PEZI|nr:hypothetical protein CPLU01_15701 [Colletotrichum plurivorum]